MTPIALILTVLAADGGLQFERQRIGDTVFEACSAFDVDRDGDLVNLDT